MNKDTKKVDRGITPFVMVALLPVFLVYWLGLVLMLLHGYLRSCASNYLVRSPDDE